MDIILAITEYLKGYENSKTVNDSFNIVNNEIFSWNFTSVPIPSKEQLQSLYNNIELKMQQEAINKEAEEFLLKTDWYIIRQLETGVPCPIEILNKRTEARNKIIR